MESFIKKIFSGKEDEQVHSQFVRFGKGEYKGRAVLNLAVSSKIKLSGSFEYANDFVSLASDFDAKFSGLILSREKLNLGNEKRKSGLFIYEVSDLSRGKIKEIENKAYSMLLDAEGEIDLKIKKKLPKPGKSGGSKINDKFCILEAGLDKLEKIKDAFFWDASGKKMKVKHDYIITELIVPENERDFEQIRIKTRRKGKIIRKLEVDGRIEEKIKEFEA